MSELYTWLTKFVILDIKIKIFKNSKVQKYYDPDCRMEMIKLNKM